MESQGSEARRLVQIPALPLMACVALGEGFSFSELQFPNL